MDSKKEKKNQGTSHSLTYDLSVTFFFVTFLKETYCWKLRAPKSSKVEEYLPQKSEMFCYWLLFSCNRVLKQCGIIHLFPGCHSGAPLNGAKSWTLSLIFSETLKIL